LSLPSGEGSAYAVRRYVLHAEIAAGSVATVHLGTLLGAGDFAHTVAIKKLRAQFAKDGDLVSMLLAGARLAARVRHSNVVPTLDVVTGGELLVVMEYVPGESLATLLRTLCGRDAQAPLTVVSGVVVGMLRGLHAVHEARGDRGEASDAPASSDQAAAPHDLLVGVDGVARLIDLGVGRTGDRAETRAVTGDLFAATVMLWEALAGRPLPPRTSPEAFDPPSRYRPEVPAEIDALVAKGLARAPAARFATANEMALALEAAVTPATQSQIGRWVESLAAPALEERQRLVAAIENPPAPAASDSTSDSASDSTSDSTSAGEPAEPAAPTPTVEEVARAESARASTLPPPPDDKQGVVTRRERASVHPFETRRGLGPPSDAKPALDATARRPSSTDWSLPRRSRATVVAIGLAAVALVAVVAGRGLLPGTRTAAPAAGPEASHEEAVRPPADAVPSPAPSADAPAQQAAATSDEIAPAPASSLSRPVTPRLPKARRSLKAARDEATPRTTRDDVL
jgi:serine/threonine-protein kinase